MKTMQLSLSEQNMVVQKEKKDKIFKMAKRHEREFEKRFK